MLNAIEIFPYAKCFAYACFQSHVWAHLSQQDCSGTKMRHLCLQDWGLLCLVIEFRQITACVCKSNM